MRLVITTSPSLVSFQVLHLLTTFQIMLRSLGKKSWHSGRVYVSLKDAVFQPSSPIRYMAKLDHILSNLDEERKMLLLHSDGSPDHWVTYLSVQVALIALFLKHNLNYVCAVRTAPCHSWHIPVERIMSILNFGLQWVGIMRG